MPQNIKRDYTLLQGSGLSVFASQFSFDGVTDRYSEIVRGLSRAYILKGTPGCGKSTKLRAAAELARRLSLEAVTIGCSADPDSLDGVVLPSLSLGIFDGTPPHAIEPRYPLVREVVLDLSRFADREALLPRRDEIVALVDKKSQIYEEARVDLCAARILNNHCRAAVRELIDGKKLSVFVKSFLSKLPKAHDRAFSGNYSEAYLTAFTKNGVTCKINAETLTQYYKINDMFLSADHILTEILDAAAQYKINAVAVPSCLDRSVLCGIYFPDSGCLIGNFNIGGIVPTIINAKRFICVDKLKRVKGKFTFYRKSGSYLLDKAASRLCECSEIHNKIESIYTANIDFDAQNAFFESFFADVFKIN